MKSDIAFDTTKKRLFSDQLQILYKNLLFSLPANLICASVVLVAIHAISNANFIWTWFYAVLVITFIRLAGFIFYYFRPQNELVSFYLFLIGLFLSAFMWGLLCSYLMPNSILEQIIIVVIIAGITSGGLQTLHANLIASLMYVCIIIFPLCTWLFLQNGIGYSAIGITMVTYLVFMITSSVRGYNLLKKSLNLAYENVALIENLSITNTKLSTSYKNLEHNNQKMEIISKMNGILQSCNNLNEAYEAIIFSAKNLFAGFNGAIAILNNSTKCLEILSQWGQDGILKKTFEINDCWALRKASNYIINNSEQNFPCFHFNKSPKAYMCMPLTTYKDILGILILYSDNMNFIELTPFLTSFTENTRLSLSNIKLRQDLYDQSIHDALTGLYNRRYLNEMLTKELSRTKRNNEKLCIAMLDVDYFKQFNDKNGHEAGDEVLKFVGTVLNQNFRHHDFPFRYGGEEFLVILENSTLSQAKQRFEDIRKTIENGKIYFSNHLLPSFTISIGIAEAPRHGKESIAIIKAADEALYLAKKNGRNCVAEYQSAETHDLG